MTAMNAKPDVEIHTGGIRKNIMLHERKHNCCRFARNRSIYLILASLFTLAGDFAIAKDFDHTHRRYNEITGMFIQDGMVNYSALKSNHKELDGYLDELAGVSEAIFDSWSESQQLALLINLYNAATLQFILDNYPLKSIKDIGNIFKGPWDQPVVRLFGENITLNTLEHEIIRKKYEEPRIHLALVCAAKGCPPLRSEAYTARDLDKQLDDQAEKFFQNPLKFRIDRQKNVVYLSPIFKWYGGDFINEYSPENGFEHLDDTEKAVLNFSSQYLRPDDRVYLTGGNYKINNLDYDWSLNEEKESN